MTEIEKMKTFRMKIERELYDLYEKVNPHKGVGYTDCSVLKEIETLEWGFNDLTNRIDLIESK